MRVTGALMKVHKKVERLAERLDPATKSAVKTHELKKSVKGMLEDRVKRGKSIPESGRKLLTERARKAESVKSSAKGYLRRKKALGKG